LNPYLYLAVVDAFDGAQLVDRNVVFAFAFIVAYFQTKLFIVVVQINCNLRLSTALAARWAGGR
jgi:hypothetical protein